MLFLQNRKKPSPVATSFHRWLVDKGSAGTYNQIQTDCDRKRSGKGAGTIMGEEISSAVRPEDLAENLIEVYRKFDEAVQAMGSKSKGGRRHSKIGASLANWIAGSHITTEREIICERFLTQVQEQLELLCAAVEGAGADETGAACRIAAEVMLEPQPVKSNATTVLMKRAVVGQLEPLLPYFPRELARECLERMRAAYPRHAQLPVEKELMKRLEQRAKG